MSTDTTDGQNAPRPGPVAPQEGASLFAGTARDLPTGRHQFHRERLMVQIQQEQRAPQDSGRPAPAKRRGLRLPRPAITLPLTAVAVATAVVLALSSGGEQPGTGLATGPALTTTVGVATTKGVPQLLDQISLAAAKTSHPTVGEGQFVYVESQTADTFVKTVDDRSSLASHVLHRRQLWMSPDGKEGWLIDPAVNDGKKGETLSLPDEKGNPREAYLNGPSYAYLAALTTDPDQFLAKIYKETAGMGNSPDQQAFTTIGDLLGESYPPAALSSALFKAAAKIPGVAVVENAVDAVGREGVAVVRLDEASGQREEWIFDRASHAFLGQRTVQVKKGTGDDALLVPGTVTHTSAITKRAVVDGIKEVPSQAG
ncbi:CU044_5270 family protein [Streptomyces sp. NPDC058417]|uniref:CU044_5270 family protein n=1 Tax=unclassified Streptomyces TaxID=2593676 RepID=UPI003646B376